CGATRWMRVVFGRHLDVPSENSRRVRGPRAQRGAARPGVCFFWLLFFAQAKKSDSRVSAKAVAIASAVAFPLFSSQQR
ncbi:hypothetical protein, partial [uncultured Xanthomonas sp.]|uniref:hypothetical protein n=1 Tax=uncultured Xanthomonas sp. TaxID=152831 RepID=UPI0025CFD176